MRANFLTKHSSLQPHGISPPSFLFLEAAAVEQGCHRCSAAVVRMLRRQCAAAAALTNFARRQLHSAAVMPRALAAPRGDCVDGRRCATPVAASSPRLICSLAAASGWAADRFGSFLLPHVQGSEHPVCASARRDASPLLPDVRFTSPSGALQSWGGVREYCLRLLHPVLLRMTTPPRWWEKFYPKRGQGDSSEEGEPETQTGEPKMGCEVKEGEGGDGERQPSRSGRAKSSDDKRSSSSEDSDGSDSGGKSSRGPVEPSGPSLGQLVFVLSFAYYIASNYRAGRGLVSLFVP
eukprot:GHVU01204881.1.p1 GENE.GHVU01204881.1~~GHVU01204881.1.p1  ORF type:complete len:293 (-),score=26.71 GHVU01204881.1:390-1268(-)